MDHSSTELGISIGSAKPHPDPTPYPELDSVSDPPDPRESGDSGEGCDLKD